MVGAVEQPPRPRRVDVGKQRQAQLDAVEDRPLAQRRDDMVGAEGLPFVSSCRSSRSIAGSGGASSSRHPGCGVAQARHQLRVPPPCSCAAGRSPTSQPARRALQAACSIRTEWQVEAAEQTPAESPDHHHSRGTGATARPTTAQRQHTSTRAAITRRFPGIGETAAEGIPTGARDGDRQGVVCRLSAQDRREIVVVEHGTALRGLDARPRCSRVARRMAASRGRDRVVATASASAWRTCRLVIFAQKIENGHGQRSRAAGDQGGHIGGRTSRPVPRALGAKPLALESLDVAPGRGRTRCPAPTGDQPRAAPTAQRSRRTGQILARLRRHRSLLPFAAAWNDARSNTRDEGGYVPSKRLYFCCGFVASAGWRR